MSAPADIRPRRDRVSEAAPDSLQGSGRWGFPLGGWRWRQPAGWRIADAVLALGLLAGLLIVTNLDHMPRGLEGFLAIRLSLKNVLFLTVFAWAWPSVLTLCGLYSPNRLRTGEGEWPRLLLAGAIGCVLALVFPLTSRSGLVTPVHALLFGVAVVPATGLLRISVRADERNRRRARPRHVVLVGSGPLTAQLFRQVMSDPLHSITVVGFVDTEPHAALAGTGVAHLGGVRDLEQVLMHRVVDDVVIGLPVKSRYDEIRQTLAACARVGVPASYSPDLFGGGSTHPGLGGRVAPALWLSATPDPELLAVKRAMDVAGSLVLLVVLAPLMLGVAVAIKLTSRGPMLFAQYRYGYMKRLFRMYKFRTMVADAEQLHAGLEGHNEASGPAFKIRDDPRVTPIGRFLRRTSLDELPQIWHVLTGKMSLVGPRPMATRDVSLFPEPWLMRRFSVRPGLTCLWQISGRSNIGFDRWIALDLQYIDNWSLWLDLQILLQTPPAIIRGTGAI